MLVCPRGHRDSRRRLDENNCNMLKEAFSCFEDCRGEEEARPRWVLRGPSRYWGTLQLPLERVEVENRGCAHLHLFREIFMCGNKHKV